MGQFDELGKFVDELDEFRKLNCKFGELDKLDNKFDELDKLKNKFGELDKLNCKFGELNKFSDDAQQSLVHRKKGLCMAVWQLIDNVAMYRYAKFYQNIHAVQEL